MLQPDTLWGWCTCLLVFPTTCTTHPVFGATLSTPFPFPPAPTPTRAINLQPCKTTTGTRRQAAAAGVGNLPGRRGDRVLCGAWLGVADWPGWAGRGGLGWPFKAVAKGLCA